MDNLENCSREELIAQIKKLKAHNTQLQHIIAKKNITGKVQNERRKSFDFQKCKSRHVLLKLLYLGWDYQGFVTQEDTSNTIEHHIFNALTKTCLIKDRSTSNYHRCGRTDKGVSSFSQVISIDVRSKSDDPQNEIEYCKILNRILPDNIQFIAWCPVGENISARFDCKGRTYKYFFPKGNLNIEKMKIASRYLVGTHDFRNFCKMDVNNGVVEFIRTVLAVEIGNFQEEEHNCYSIYVLTIKGNAFLWHQIRCIVGLLILIGQNKETPDIILELLDVASNPRKPDYHMASEIPLNLYDCQYEHEDWIYDKNALESVITKLSNVWTFSSVKSAMVKSMLLDMEKQFDAESYDTSDCLIPGVKPRNYTPVMKRQLCDSLEEKISKKRKRKGDNSTTFQENSLL